MLFTPRYFDATLLLLRATADAMSRADAADEPLRRQRHICCSDKSARARDAPRHAMMPP